LTVFPEADALGLHSSAPYTRTGNKWIRFYKYAASESERNSIWWRRRELNSTEKKNNFSQSCVVRHKVSVNKDVRARLNFLLSDWHHAP